MQWLSDLQKAIDQPPLHPRVPLFWQGIVVGSVEPNLVQRLQSHPLPLRAGVGGPLEHGSGFELTSADLSEGLAVLAQALKQLGMAGAWRNECLAVCDADGKKLGEIERGATRPLGIATEAVHLVGWTHDQKLWVQQRSLTKANDPGLWDTLMGGMVSAQDTVETALVRETWEEAGLQLATLPAPLKGGVFCQRRPSDDGVGGYLVETTHWYHLTLPEGVIPVNQDGEVAQFACLSPQEVVAGLAKGDYTREASWILVKALADDLPEVQQA